MLRLIVATLWLTCQAAVPQRWLVAKFLVSPMIPAWSPESAAAPPLAPKFGGADPRTTLIMFVEDSPTPTIVSSQAKADPFVCCVPPRTQL